MAKSLSIFVISALIFVGIPLAWSADYFVLLFVSNISPSILLSAVYLILPIIFVRMVFHRAISVELREKEFSLLRSLFVGLVVLALIVALAVVSKLTFRFFLETL